MGRRNQLFGVGPRVVFEAQCKTVGLVGEDGTSGANPPLALAQVSLPNGACISRDLSHVPAPYRESSIARVAPG
jgi:hypothetical protein